MPDPTPANDNDLDAAQVNALLQARGTGRVGAILAVNGTPTKNGAASLAMLRALVDRGWLVETPVVDENQKTIIYFDRARRADLDFLDAAASQTIVALAQDIEELRKLAVKTDGFTKELEDEMKKLDGFLAAFEVDVKMIRGLISNAESGAEEMAAKGGHDHEAWSRMAEASRAIGALIDDTMK